MRGGPVNTVVFELDTNDFLEMEQALGTWDQRYRQVGRGRFRGVLLHTQTESLEIVRNLWRKRIHCRGRPPDGTVAVGITLAQTGEARWMGRRVSADDLLIQRFNAEADYMSGSVSDRVVFTIPEAELATRIGLRTDADPELVLSCSVVRLDARVAARLRQACLEYLGMVWSSLATADRGAMLERVAQHLVEMLSEALVPGGHSYEPRSSVAQQPFGLIRRTEDYCSGTPDRPMRIGQLSREIGVSERTLRDAFHRMTGMGPHAWLKTMQLNRVYRTLRFADPDEVLVKQVAIANGFFHFGQFSSDYKRLFGELPSETLQRAPFDARICADRARRSILSPLGQTARSGALGDQGRTAR